MYPRHALGISGIATMLCIAPYNKSLIRQVELQATRYTPGHKILMVIVHTYFYLKLLLFNKKPYVVPF